MKGYNLFPIAYSEILLNDLTNFKNERSIS